jgi:hypothetical protein
MDGHYFGIDGGNGKIELIDSKNFKYIDTLDVNS